MKGRSLTVAAAAARAAASDSSGEPAVRAVAALPGSAGEQPGEEAEGGEGAHEWVEEGGLLRQLPSSTSDAGGGSKAGGRVVPEEPTLRLSDVAGAEGATAPTLVSILLPANASGGEGGPAGLLASLGKVFVVMLHPRQKYVISACNLQPSLLP